ncbi:MAG: isomerizing glutamine--fructose-6-phosphate transaminase, partial [Spirochaetes bacterium]|nr:isomerizing glutamine--fructose-6-phosphate transaminase [Spirochaetota bacterium]
MCGIVGYIGQGDTVNILLEGLKRLEYRGYDSSGIGILQKNKIKIYKKEGRISNLQSFIPNNLQTHCGIAHTRWATHGQVNDSNAHPHFSYDQKVAVIHNGIIDNYLDLKKQLESEGYPFQSDTDTEIIASLISKFLSVEKNIENAINQALQKLEGTYGLLILLTDYPDLIIGARSGSPLVLGIGENQMYIASDPNALIRFTNQVIYIADGETIFVKQDSYTTTNIHNQLVEKQIENIEWQAEEAELGEYSTYMLKEIFEQPEAIRRAYGEGGRLLAEFGNAKLGGLNLSTRELLDIKKIHFFSMGTGYYSSMIGCYLMETLARIPAT